MVLDTLGIPTLDQYAAMNEALLIGGLLQHELTEKSELLNKQLRDEIAIRKQAEEALQDGERHKDAFLAMLAHELRNPLSSIYNAVELLIHHGLVDDVQRRVSEIIERQARHMNHLINDLLDVSRITRGKVLLEMEQIDLCSIVRATVGDHSAALESRGLAIDLQLPVHPVWIMGDATRVAQIAGNLFHNAKKFTPDEGRVTVCVEVHGSTARLIVRDTGIGIEPHMLKSIFDVFVQVDSSMVRSKGGLGLGLALIKGLVEMHGGTVRASSAGIGLGAEFQIDFPLIAADPLVPPAINAPQTRSSYRVLLIEDNEDTAQVMSLLMNRRGHTCETAFSGAEGIEKAVHFIPDAIVCDVGLPDMNGFDVAKALRTNTATKDMCLIALTGYGQESDILRTQEAGFDAHLTKPVKVGVIEDTIAKIMAKKAK